MMRKKIAILFLGIFFLLEHPPLVAQVAKDTIRILDTSSIKISSIVVTGNKQTKTYIILREMQFGAGDKIPAVNISKEFKQARNQVYNTNLFIEVKIDSVVLADASLQVNVAVKERWYIYPTPQFKLVDRSFNEWIKTFNADFNRVVYGIDFTHYNISGRRDKFGVTLLNGYARNISIGYNSPYSNPSLTQGFAVSGGFTQNREINYKTTYNNGQLRYKKDGFVRSSYDADMGISFRKGFFKQSAITLGINYVSIDDSILTSLYNPKYFNSNKTNQFYTDIGFRIAYANTDKNAYPLKGEIYNYGLLKRGFGFTGGINNTTLFGAFTKFITHKRHFYSTLKAAGTLKIPFEQAYINQRAIGFGDLNLRGLELYVVDAVAAATFNYTFSKKLVSFRIPMPFKIKAVPYIPVSIFAKTYTDIGYGYIPQQYNTRLSNRFLYTGGFGIDILTLYDIAVKVEYSFNQLGEKGLFLRGGGGF